MKETKKAKKEPKEVTARARLHYISIRLAELTAERAKLVEERKELVTQRRSEGGGASKKG